MKTLTLTSPFANKLDRLRDKVGELSYLGEDLDSYHDQTLVAVVGTRKPTPYGTRYTQEIVADLSRAGVVIVSGLALGVDCLAHQAALDAGGRTIAVLPSGLETVYPSTNRPVAKEILAKNGTLISEYGATRRPRKVEFLERNRIIAALSDAVFIPEAAAHSGSLHTAHNAVQMDIPLYILPGNADQPMSAGTNYLLTSRKAHAVTEARHILATLGISSKKQGQLALDLTGDTPEQTLILQKVALGIAEIPALQEATKLSTEELQIALSMLEVDGKITTDQLDGVRLR